MLDQLLDRVRGILRRHAYRAQISRIPQASEQLG
jgi:hypothetical protein